MSKKKRKIAGTSTAGEATPLARPAGVPAAAARNDWTVIIFACMLFLVAAIGAPYEEMLQDTLKSIVVSFAALGAGLLFFWRQRQRHEYFHWHALMGFPLALMAYALGSMVWSHTYLAGVEAIRWFIFSLLLWLGLNTFTREKSPSLFWGIHAGAVVASLWTALQFWIDFRFFSQGPNPASTFVNRNFFAEYVVCTLPFSALLIARAGKPQEIAWLTFTTAFNIVALLMTGTRSALATLWVLLFLVLPLAGFFYRRQLACFAWNLTQRLAVIALLLVTIVGLGLIHTGNPKIAGELNGRNALERGIFRTVSVVTDSDEFRTGSLSVRLTMWKATGRMIQDRPLSGVGAGAWEVNGPLYQTAGSQLETDYYAHNEPLQLLAEYGLVGWLALAGLLGYLGLAAWRTLGDRRPEAMDEGPVRAAALACLLALLMVSNAGFAWRLASTGALFAVLLGLLAASDARLGYRGFSGGSRLPWHPVLSRTAMWALAASLALATYISQQAAESERKIIGAVKLALMISGSGNPGHPQWNQTKKHMLRLIGEGIAINPHYRKITPIVADELARWGDWKNATWIWESVLASRPYIVGIMVNIARGYAQQGDNDKAFAYLARCKKLQPQAVSVRALEVILLGHVGNEAEATRLAKQYLKDGTYNYDLLNAAWLLGTQNNDPDLAIEAIKLRNKGWPDQEIDGLLKLGDLFAAQKKDDARALASYRAALKAAPHNLRDAVRQRIPAAYLPRL
ncbi:O-antigen ligase family protein [Polaromonas sp. JS666]|uniref:O-antigen ligase family protein n=1 Tax=Polaromonas sp. (strain JS666 / ATCC BAA-500) TaxID=296591 RepID=UPI0000D5B3E2|nr:O-antigen ligase family protein [Polaromonas sp. JS666]ABE44440.1 O-antigen polymerase [Polaromonas sp. JS666]